MTWQHTSAHTGDGKKKTRKTAKKENLVTNMRIGKKKNTIVLVTNFGQRTNESFRRKVSHGNNQAQHRSAT